MAGSILRSHGPRMASPLRPRLSSRSVYPHLPASICAIARRGLGGDRSWRRGRSARQAVTRLARSEPLLNVADLSDCVRGRGFVAR